MSAWRSTPEGWSLVGWRVLAGTSVAMWLLPSALGLVMEGVVHGIGPEAWGAGWLLWAGVASLLLLSPMVTWAGFSILGIGAAFLLRRGAFGWVSALALGGFAGLSLALLTRDPLPVLVGAYLALMLRLVLAIRAPLAF